MVEHLPLFPDLAHSRAGITPRDYQIKDHDESFRLWDAGTVGVLTRGFTGCGKCLGEGTPVMLRSGEVVPVEQIEPRDVLMGPDSKSRHVLSVTRGYGPLYLITPNKGMPFVVNDVHMLTLRATNFNAPSLHGLHPGEIIDIPLNEYLRKPKNFKHIAKGFRVPVDFLEQELPLPLDPYFLGVWLGDGHSLVDGVGPVAVTTADAEIVDLVKQVAAEYMLDVTTAPAGGKSATYKIVEASRTHRRLVGNGVLSRLRSAMPGTKHIPHAYKTASRKDRLSLLAGLMDTDGSHHAAGFDFVSKFRQLSEDVAFVARSVGLAAYVKECRKSSQRGTVGTYWRVSINGDCTIIPTRLKHKKAQARRCKKDVTSFGFSVTYIGDGPYYGFTLDGDGRFLLGDFTVTHNTLMSCIKADTWMQRSDRHYVLILSYEEQLVNQYVQEVIDYLGVTPGVEMAGQKVTAGSLPRITVASRASLLYHKPPTEDQIAELRKHGINDPGAAPREKISTLLRYLRNGVCVQEVADELARINEQPEAANGKWSRVHKFDWRFNWLLILDEAHKHAHHLKSVGPIIDWFDQNPESRRLGQTATPKRSDGVSIGDKMFPGIALDYPLYKPDAPCGVLDGWAVPYVQRYIKVNGVDFKGLKKVAGDFDEGELGMVLGKEETLAALVEPLLDMAEDRRTLIFSPTVQMAKDVASYINARSRAVCTCGTMKWYPTLLIGDGAQCPSCQRMIDSCDVDINTQQAAEIDGETTDRTTIYKRHQKGDIQFLSICGLCREGYNDREISCVAVFRPVSRKASALAEQMKGRGCRVLPGVVDGGLTKEQRLAAIDLSNKRDCLIVDLVGITGLGDCASTIQIYSEGLPDEIQQRAEDILAEQGLDGEIGVIDAISQAKREDEEAKRRAKEERERAEQHARDQAAKRAKADAQVDYTTHDVGSQRNVTDKNEASEKMYRWIASLGMNIVNTKLSKRQAWRIADQLLSGEPAEMVAHVNGLDEGNWEPCGPSAKQQYAIRSLQVEWVKCGTDASYVISAMKNPVEFVERVTKDMDRAKTNAHLTTVAKRLVNTGKSVRIDPDVYRRLVNYGQSCRGRLGTKDEF